MSLFANRRGKSSSGGGSTTPPPVGTESSIGVVKFAEANQVAPLLAVQANDPRLSKEVMISSTQPSDTNMLWLDTSLSEPLLKYYQSNSWKPISGKTLFIQSNTPPTDITKLWIDDSAGMTIKYYDEQADDWVSITSSGPIESEDVLYNNTGYPLLDNVKKTLDNILNKIYYVTPVISSFTNNINMVEKGSTINAINLSWSINKPITSISLNQGIGTLSVSAANHSLTGLNLTTDTTYTLTISDGTTNLNASTSVLFRQKRYWGTNANVTLTNAEVLALSSEFSTTRTQSKTINGNGQYIYFAWPTTFGTPNFKVNGLVNNAWIKDTISFTNASGFVEIYDVYRSQYSQNGTGIVVDIT